ncbi:hypothetical protein J2T13_003325 [Paenibacillus sp. DS2015]
MICNGRTVAIVAAVLFLYRELVAIRGGVWFYKKNECMFEKMLGKRSETRYYYKYKR